MQNYRMSSFNMYYSKETANISNVHTKDECERVQNNFKIIYYTLI